MVVSGVTMSEDKKTASVSLFSNFENGVSYEISVKGYEETVTLVAFVGKPVSMTISSKSGIQNGMFVTINTVTELTYNLFDEQGNDVTNTIANTNVFFTTANYNVNDYYVSGKTIYIFKEGVQAAVNAEFHTADSKLTASATFVGVNATPVTFKSVELKVKRPWADYATGIVPLGDCYNAWEMSEVLIDFKVQTTAHDDYYAKNYNDTLSNSIGYLGYPHWIEFRSSNPDVADVIWAERYGAGNQQLNPVDGKYYDQDGNLVNQYNQLLDENGDVIRDAKLRLFKEGTTAVLADIVSLNPDGTRNVNTVVSALVKVGAPRAFQNIEAFGNNGSVIVGTEEGYTTEKIIFLAKDQYGDCLEIGNGLKNANTAREKTYTVEYTFADGSAVPAGAINLVYENGWQNVFYVDGSKFLTKMNGAAVKQFYIKVKGEAIDNNSSAGKYGDSKVEFSFVIEVRKKVSDTVTSLSVTSWSDMPNGSNVGRYNTPYDGNGNTEGAKKTTFQVFQMNNGIKVGQLDVTKKTSTTTPVVGKYYYTVERNGVDITSCTDMVNVADNGKDVVLNYSKLAEVTMTKHTNNGVAYTVTGSAVSYNAANGTRFAEGNYVFTLYKAERINNNTVYTQVGATSVSATFDTEKYTFAKRTSEVAEYYDNNGNLHKLGNVWSNEQLAQLANQEVLRNCFEIKGRDGNPTGSPYFVNAVNADTYVFVKSITFFEEFNGVYAPYTVDVNVSLVKPQ